MSNVLEMNGIEKRFGPVHALNNVDFSVAKGEIHALLGVNGAGKSTLIKIISGIYTPDAGQIVLDGDEAKIRSPSDAISKGIASVQQHPELVGDFTGRENIFLGQESKSRGLFSGLNTGVMQIRAQELLKRFPIGIDLDVPVDNLSGVEREIIAILHSLKQENVKVLILDEPTSTLTQVEAEQLFGMMRTLKDAGVSIIYITHRLDEVFEIADRFTVFRGGENIACMSVTEARSSGVSIPNLMLQQQMGELFPDKVATPDGHAHLQVNNLSGDGFQNVSFDVQKGEIVGFFGLVGSGIDELAKTLFGVIQPTSGTLQIADTIVVFDDSADALQHGIFLLPGDRRVEGLVMTDDVIFNSTLANLPRAAGFGWLRKFGKNRRDVAELAAQVDLQPPTLNRPLSAFSGGNQQKVVLAKGLYRQADIYIFVEPTVGVDVGARAKIYGLIRELSKDAAVIVMSSDCDEAYGLSDRVGALYRGTLSLVPNAESGRDSVMAAGFQGAVVK